jgi:RNA polymerase sigma-70 factor (ECF subfamily)
LRTRNQYSCLDEIAAKLIRRKARQLVGRKGLVEEDVHDLEQELALQVWRSQQRYDPARSTPETFTSRVLANTAAKILQARCAAKRDPGPSPDRGVDPPGVAEVIDISDMLAVERSRQNDVALRIDMGKALGRLPVRHRLLCAGLARGSISEVSKQTGTPRATIYDACTAMRAFFERAGLRVYLDASDEFATVPVGNR